LVFSGTIIVVRLDRGGKCKCAHNQRYRNIPKKGIRFDRRLHFGIVLPMPFNPEIQ